MKILYHEVTIDHTRRGLYTINMNILIIADRPPSHPLKEFISINRVELLITLGDLGQHQLSELELIDDIPKIGVYGNHDSGMYFEPLGIQNLHLTTTSINGITFGGFEGCVRYKSSGNLMYTQEEATKLMNDFPKVDIFISHCPPFGINDDSSDIAHTGFIALKNYIEQHQPMYLFHGHTYPSANNIIKQHGDTNIEYVFGDKLFSILNN